MHFRVFTLNSKKLEEDSTKRNHENEISYLQRNHEKEIAELQRKHALEVMAVKSSKSVFVDKYHIYTGLVLQADKRMGIFFRYRLVYLIYNMRWFSLYEGVFITITFNT